MALLALLDAEPALTAKVLLERWGSVEEQLRHGCVIAATSLAGKVLQQANRSDLARTAVDIALERFVSETQVLGRRQLARLLHQVVPLLNDTQHLGRLTQLLQEEEQAADTATERYLSEAALSLCCR